VRVQATSEPRRRTSAVGLLGRAVRELTDRVTACGLPLKAFACSRLLVLVAGVAGVLTVRAQAAGQGISGRMASVGPIGNATAGAVFHQFDASYYLAIASHGYVAAAPNNLAFFPLYPSLIRALGFLTGSDVIAGLVISTVSFALALVLLHRLTELELGSRAADATVLLVAFAPLSFFFTAIYTESLFLLLSVAAVLAARRERWALAGVLAALAALTRPTGILLVVPLVIMRLGRQRRLDRQLAWALSPVAALGVYLAILAANGFSWLAPFRVEAFWQRVTVGPITGIASAVVTAVNSAAAIVRHGQPVFAPTLGGPFTPNAECVLLLLVLVIAVVCLVACFRRLPLEYGAYGAAVLLMCVSSPAVGQPLVSFDRYVLTIFPLWMAAGAWIATRRLQRVAVAAGSILLVFYTLYFARGSFIA
jgi:Mannosyltransferase (PIG-V)